MDKKMKVEVWSDIACPFCYIGKRHFEKALENFQYKDKVEVKWKSFQLDPFAEKNQSMNVHEMLAKKYGRSVEQARQMSQNVVSMASTAGLAFNMDEVKLTNTFDAHRLIHLAEKYDLQDIAKERLLKAYFINSENVGNHDTLVRIAGEIGLNEEETHNMLNSSDYEGEVKNDINEAQQLGISGVPFFVIDEKYGISGAQPTEQILEVLNDVWKKEHAKINIVSDGGICTPDGICK